MSTSTKAELEYLIAYCNEASIDGADVPPEKLQRIATALRGALILLGDAGRIDALERMIRRAAELEEGWVSIQITEGTDPQTGCVELDAMSQHMTYIAVSGDSLRAAIDAAGGAVDDR